MIKGISWALLTSAINQIIALRGIAVANTVLVIRSGGITDVLANLLSCIINCAEGTEAALSINHKHPINALAHSIHIDLICIRAWIDRICASHCQ